MNRKKLKNQEIINKEMLKRKFKNIWNIEEIITKKIVYFIICKVLLDVKTTHQNINYCKIIYIFYKN